MQRQMWEAPTSGVLMSFQLIAGVFLAVVVMLGFYLVTDEQGR